MLISKVSNVLVTQKVLWNHRFIYFFYLKKANIKFILLFFRVLNQWKQNKKNLVSQMCCDYFFETKGNVISTKDAIHVESAKEVNNNSGKKVKMQ